MKIVRFVSIGGVLAALAVILQSSPVFLPVVGLALSPFSTVPIAIAAYLNVYLGAAVLFSSSLILLIISPQEALILLFTTGLLGAVIGMLLKRKSSLIMILLSAFSLTMGMCILTYLLAIPGFTEIAASFSLPLIILFFFSFSLVYAAIWSILIKRIIKLMIRIKVIDRT